MLILKNFLFFTYINLGNPKLHAMVRLFNQVCISNANRICGYFMCFVLSVCISMIWQFTVKKLAVNCVTARYINGLNIYSKSSVSSFLFALLSWCCAIESRCAERL